MSVYFNAHPVVAGMGLRESINAMLERVAYNRYDFGYLPYYVHTSNNRRLSEDFIECIKPGDVLKLRAVIEDSSELARLVETLLMLCNDYPCYDDSDAAVLADERAVDALVEELGVPAHLAPDVLLAYVEAGGHVEQNVYGASFDDEKLLVAKTEAGVF